MLQRGFKFLIVSLLAFLLVACAAEYKKSYTYVPPKAHRGKMCVIECQQARRMCNSLSSKENTQCIDQAQRNAQFHYKAYKEEREKAGLPVKRGLESFYNDSQCQAKSECEEDYKACYQLCGGKVLEQSHCVKNC